MLKISRKSQGTVNYGWDKASLPPKKKSKEERKRKKRGKIVFLLCIYSLLFTYGNFIALTWLKQYKKK